MAPSPLPDAEVRRVIQDLIWAVEARDSVAVVDLADYLTSLFRREKP